MLRRAVQTVAAAVLVALALAACGSDDDGGGGTDAESARPSTAPTNPAPPPDPAPRVEGRWRALYMPRDPEDEPVRTTWTVRPRCDRGACSFTARSSGGATFRFRYDAAIGDYNARFTFNDNCINLDTGERVAADVYRVRTRMTLAPSAAVQTTAAQVATELLGERSERSMPLPSAPSGCQDATTERFDLRLVRIKPPAGTPVPGTDLPSVPALPGE
jgi:hypothetical protein